MRSLAMLAVLLIASTAQAEAAAKLSERVTCSIAASLKFGIPADMLLAVAETEGGRPGQWVRNDNGTYDVGPLQFNTRYLEHLQRQYGITAADVAAAGCYSYELAAWRLRKHLEFDRGDQWTRVANYHSRNPEENAMYRYKLVRAAARWSAWLSKHFAGRDMSVAEASEKFSGELHRSRAETDAMRRPKPVKLPAQPRPEDCSKDCAETAALLALIDNEVGRLRHRSRSMHSAGARARALQRQAEQPATQTESMLLLLGR